MMKFSILLIIMLSFFSITFSQSFENLEKLEEQGYVVRFQKNLTEIARKEISDGYTVYQLIKTKINKDQDKWYTITYDPGPSSDPMFRIDYINGSKSEEIAVLYGEELIIPGNGLLYTKCRSNSYFEKKSKFKLENNKITEIKQAAYYVGVKGKTLKAITLYSDKEQKQILASLPENYSIEVLINEDDDNYLIKTPFGLVGWIKLSPGYLMPIIEGMTWQGD
jgi:hypothetical protein